MGTALLPLMAPAHRTAPPLRTLRAQLLVNLGFVTSAAVLLVGITTALLAGADLQDTAWGLAALWAGSTAVFALFGVHLVDRILIQPLAALSTEADTLAAGNLAAPAASYESAELAHLAGRYRTMAADLLDVHSQIVRVEKLAGIGSLAAGVAHEVRNPLGALDLFAGLLAEELQGAQASHVARIKSELAALSKVVEEFLDYARARPPVREAVNLTSLAAEVADLAAPLAAARQVSVSPHGEGEARADGEQLRRAVLNLVRNAIEAAPAASDVELDARVVGPRVVFEVRDRGPGLAKEARESLFRPFFTTKERGTGLGLALAKKVADAHGGRLQLLDREQGGTVARLAIPVTPR